MAANAPPRSSTSSSSADAASSISEVALLDDPGSFEEVLVFEEVGLVGEHLLDAKRPLLVPGPGEPEGLVPGGQLDGARPVVARQRDAQGLEHDPLEVVLRLGLGEAERVDLHAVAEAAKSGIAHAEALVAEAIPKPPERPHLACLLHETYPRVHEERHPPHDLAQVIGSDLAGGAHCVEDGDCGREGIGDLLDGRRSSFLQVVGADVDRVPPRHVPDRVADEVDSAAQARARREDVGAAGEVFLDEVVLCGPGEKRRRDAMLLGVGHVTAEEPRGCGVDRHRGVHLRDRDARE